eukprot:SAG25_NODE_8798_length_403_cov_1.023026_1_plen_77_part_01
MQNLSMLEANMNAVERVTFFSAIENVAQEGPRQSGLPPPSWPSKGEIEIDHLSLHYGNPQQLVLKAVKASIGARDKI